MSEWWTYRPSDFLMFSARVYERLIESFNTGLWPWHLLAVALGVATLALAARNDRLSDRLALGLAGAGMVSAAWLFLWLRYANVNWAASYAAPAMALAGVAMIAVAVSRKPPLRERPRDAEHTLGLAVAALGIVAWPAATGLLGGSVEAIELAGLLPDATALAALGLSGLARGGAVAVGLAVVPFGWAIYSAVTLFTLGAPQAWLLAAGLALTVSLAARRVAK